MRRQRTPQQTAVRDREVRDALHAFATRGGRKVRHPGPAVTLTETEKDGQVRPEERRGKLYPNRYFRHRLRAETRA